MAYATLATRHDDAAFARVMNTPPRGLPQEAIMGAIERQRDALLLEAARTHRSGSHAGAASDDVGVVSLEDAAELIVRTSVGLGTPVRLQKLRKFLALLHLLRARALDTDLGSFVLLVWTESGMQVGARALPSVHWTLSLVHCRLFTVACALGTVDC